MILVISNQKYSLAYLRLQNAGFGAKALLIPQRSSVRTIQENYEEKLHGIVWAVVRDTVGS